MAAKDKTNAMRKLEQMKISYQDYYYDQSEAISGVEVARLLGQNEKQVFKTLVTTGKSGNHYVFVIPVAKELDLKKAAKVAGEKSIEMLKSKDLLGLTGYIHGGCSPIGMKKLFRTFVHETAKEWETIIFSGGKRGYQIQLSLEQLGQVIPIETADVIKC